MARRYLFSGIILITALLSGCAFNSEPETRTVTEVETQEVYIPVPYAIDLPEELQEPYTPETKPRFVDPNSDDAVVGLTVKGVQDFRAFTFDMLRQIRLWESHSGVRESEEETDGN